jgi:glycerol-3-phosphate dehydrogenase subunit C
MTTTYDPQHPDYLDEADIRNELTRVFDVCGSCRRCIDLCGAFPSLFEILDRRGGDDAGLMTPAEQDRVVDACFQCMRCRLNCPYSPALHELDIDFPRLMLRAEAMKRANGINPPRSRTAIDVLARTDTVGAFGSATSSLTNRMIAKPGSLARRLLAATTGVSAVRLLPPFARQRFSTWFARRAPVMAGERHKTVTIFPTCLVEYGQPEIGKDLVKVYERNGIECTVSDARCCGAPWLHAGDLRRFAKLAERNAATLADEIRRGTDVVVPQATCSYVLKHDYADHVGGADAELVAAHTFDAAEYLMNAHLEDGTALDSMFHGEIPDHITYHAPCHLRAQEIGFKSRDLLKLTGAEVTVVQQCAGIDGTWGLRAGNEEVSMRLGAALAEELDQAGDEVGGDVVAGDCHLANTAILEQLGRPARHPIQVIARAYGIPEEE